MYINALVNILSNANAIFILELWTKGPSGQVFRSRPRGGTCLGCSVGKNKPMIFFFFFFFFFLLIMQIGPVSSYYWFP